MKNQRVKNQESMFTNVPPEIMIDILSRLPIPTVISCKCVCKSLLNLVETLEFAKSRFSKSVPVPGLALDEGRPLTLALFRGEQCSKPYKLLESVDTRNSGHQFYVVFEFNFPHPELVVHSSANGLLLLLSKYEKMPLNLFICNPITREYIKLPPLLLRPSSSMHHQDNAFGFGVSKLTGKYKVVRMFRASSSSSQAPCKCEVYTLGTGSWRSVATGGPLLSIKESLGVFLNGNLHWLAQGLQKVDSLLRISYFDLETECFSTFSIPRDCHYSHCVKNLCALGDSLCLCDSALHVVNIWLMNEYGDEKSWRKEFFITKPLGRSLPGPVVPIKRFDNGDILFANQLCPKLYCYSSETKTMREVDLTKPFAEVGMKPSIYVPSFLPLKTFAMENVSSF